MIRGNPTVSAAYTIDGAAVSGENSTVLITSNFVEFANGQVLNSYLREGDKIAYIVGSLSLVYQTETAIEAQFLVKANDNDHTIGVSISGSSHVAYGRDLYRIRRSI